MKRRASLVDVVPTCLEAADIAADREEFDGKSLLQEPSNADRTVLCDTILDWDGLICRTIIGRRHKLTTYTGESYGEFFDLERDPGETKNLWNDSAAAAARESMLRALADHDTRLQRSSRPRIANA